jgi:hypothetical protein
MTNFYILFSYQKGELHIIINNACNIPKHMEEDKAITSPPPIVAE